MAYLTYLLCDLNIFYYHNISLALLLTLTISFEQICCLQKFLAKDFYKLLVLRRINFLGNIHILFIFKLFSPIMVSIIKLKNNIFSQIHMCTLFSFSFKKLNFRYHNCLFLNTVAFPFYLCADLCSFREMQGQLYY